MTKKGIMDKEINQFLISHLGTSNFDLLPIKKGGSDRSFFRVSLPDQASFIFMHYGINVEENSHWIDINNFLNGIGVCVPQIIAQDTWLHFILLEDLGDVDLWSQRNQPWEKRREYYFQVLRQIQKLHSFDLNRLPAVLPLAEAYSERLYRWEHDYFRENFVAAVCGLELSTSFINDLEKELSELTGRLHKIEPSLIHRDFQSQNIMLKNGLPVFIDFQGMRRGCFFYDLGSLIYDPYVLFTDNERNELILFYFNLMNTSCSFEEFINNFREASAQRLMQALGAYGFLGLKKKKTDFLKHVDNGISNLVQATSLVKTLPVLTNLANQCIQKLARYKL